MSLTEAPAGPAGLAPRLAAAARLRGVLAGARFSPLGAGDIADPRDRAFANRLLTTTLRRHGHLDLVIAKLLDRGLPARSGNFEAILRLALAQLLYLPEAGDHSALFLAVEAVKRDRRSAHLAKLMNAVLRRAQAMADDFRALPHEALFPQLLRDRWRAVYGEAALTGFAEALLAGAPLDLTLCDSGPELLTALAGTRLLPDVVRLETRDAAVENLPFFSEGRWWVQDVAASLPARLIDRAAGADVLDLCAAPGGKTAQLLKAGYRVTALDSDADRLGRLGGNLARLGYTAEMVHADAESYVPPTGADAVLLDAPCSATGTFRRHPEVVWHRAAADITGRAAVQRRLLASASRMLAPGGTLVYCVCSLEPEEGEAQAAWACHNLGLVPSPIEPAELGAFGTAVTPDGYLRTHPGMALPTPAAGTLDGFFAARFHRA